MTTLDLVPSMYAALQTFCTVVVPLCRSGDLVAIETNRPVSIRVERRNRHNTLANLSTSSRSTTISAL